MTATGAPAPRLAASGAVVGQGSAARAKPSIPHQPALDGLRGLAVAGVLLYHGGHLRGGYLGVDAFFVLSGYLITSLLLEEFRTSGTIRLRDFWLRRARRLLPAIFVVLVGVAIWSRAVANPVQWPSIRGDGIATLFYVANWHTIASGMPYGATLLGRSPLEHTWSLAIEEQFYVVWPLLVVALLAVRRAARMIFWAATAIVGLGTALLIGLSWAGVASNTLYLGTHTRMAAIGFGAMVASWQVMRRNSPPGEAFRRRLDLVAVAVLALLLVGWAKVDLNGLFLYRGGLTLAGLAVAVVIASVTLSPRSLVGRALSVAPLRGLGLISYGVYLWHWPIYLLLDAHRTGIDGLPLLGVRIAVSIAVAIVSYELLEQPIRRSSWSIPRMASFSGVGAVVSVGALVLMAVGAPANPLTPTSTKRIVAGPKGSPVVAMYGDSVAYFLGQDGIGTRAKKLGISFDQLAQLGCEPLGEVGAAIDGYGDPVGRDAWQNCIDKIAVYPQNLKVRPDVGIILFGGIQWDVKVGSTYFHPCDPWYQDHYRQRIASLVARAQRGGTKIVIVRPAPIVSPSVADTTGISDAASREACLWRSIQPILKRPGVSSIDMDARYCTPDGRCDRQGPDAANRTDGVHFVKGSAATLADWLVPAALAAAGR